MISLQGPVRFARVQDDNETVDTSFTRLSLYRLDQHDDTDGYPMKAIARDLFPVPDADENNPVYRFILPRYGTDIKVVDGRTGAALEVWHWTGGGFISSIASDCGGSAR
jgi:hypothetical protein